MKDIEELYYAYKDDVFKYLLLKTRDSHKAEEILAETFYQVIKSISSFKGLSSEKTWIISIAKNTWLNSLKKNKETPGLDEILEFYSDDGIDLAEDFLDKELSERIVQILRESDPKAGEIIRMRSEGFDFTEIAEILGISSSSCRVIHHRTKESIKNKLKKEGLI